MNSENQHSTWQINLSIIHKLGIQIIPPWLIHLGSRFKLGLGLFQMEENLPLVEK